MSVRIHKMAGWGLKGLHVRNGIHDFRINPDCDPRQDFPVSKFADFMERKKNRILEFLLPDSETTVGPDQARKHAELEFDGELWLLRNHRRKKSGGLKNSVVFEDGHGSNSGILLIRPVTQPDWFRWDDTLDWIEETGTHGQRCRTVVFKTGIHPYNNWMVRFRDPPAPLVRKWKKKPVSGLSGHWTVDEKGFLGMAAGDWNRKTGFWDKNIEPAVKGETLRHFLEDWRPAIPVGVVALALWSEAFTDLESSINELRPMFHVWWD